MQDKIKEAIETGIQQAVEEVFERKKQEMIEEMDREKDKIVASVSINVMQHVKIESFGNELSIRIATDRFK